MPALRSHLHSASLCLRPLMREVTYLTLLHGKEEDKWNLVGRKGGEEWSNFRIVLFSNTYSPIVMLRGGKRYLPGRESPPRGADVW